MSSLQSVLLYTNTLTGTIPTEFGLMSSLQSLFLNSSSLTGTIPTEIGLMSFLQTLYLYSNSLSGTIPTEIGLMSSLQSVYLYTSSLTGTIPTETGLMSSLQSLDLRSNSLTGPVPSSLCNHGFTLFSLCTTGCSGYTAYPSCLNASILNVSPIPPYIPCPAGTRLFGIVDHRLVISTRLSCCRRLHPRC
jgi:hypothetical protein